MVSSEKKSLLEEMVRFWLNGIETPTSPFLLDLKKSYIPEGHHSLLIV